MLALRALFEQTGTTPADIGTVELNQASIGAILTLRVAQDLVRRDLELRIVTMCIGGGQALAALFRRVA